MANWFKNSKYKKDDALDIWGNNAVWRPKYDLSVSLEVRIKQLIRTITGKELKLAQAAGWGNDGTTFFYNPNDLTNATDDEVLGRILQQLGQEMFVPKFAVGKLNEKEPAYKHLVNSLEANRADRQLNLQYGGTGYYAGQLWASRKFTDNPLNQYSEKAKPNDAWEFCFNIHALQNGEEQFDFSNQPMADNFVKALPFINEYLNGENFEQAMLAYPKIKELYPVPDAQQQQQMDGGMGATQGLSKQQMEAAAKQEAMLGEGKGELNAEHFVFDFADNDYHGKRYDDKANLATHNSYLAPYQPTANVLASLIRSILTDNRTKRFVRPFKRGKLDAKSMYKYLGTGNLRIFKKPRAISKQEYLWSLVVDMSGSMNGSKAKIATKASIVMANVLEQLGFAYQVLAYNGQVYTVKTFNQKLNKGHLTVLEYANGDNNELDTIKQITKDVIKQDGSNSYRKGVFWITDGEAYHPDEVKKEISKFEAQQDATVFAIGLGSSINKEHLDRSYTHSLHVPNIQALPSELISIMRGQFRRG